jgi:uncharacterized membrane protein
VLVLVSSFILVLIFLPFSSEKYSEIWVLDEDRMANDLPRSIEGNHMIYVGVENHRGVEESYLVSVKLRDLDQVRLDSSSSGPSSSPSIHDFSLVVDDGDFVEIPVELSFGDIDVGNDSLVLGDITLNGMSYSLDQTIFKEEDLFSVQLIFELYLFDELSEGYVFQDLSVSFWLHYSPLFM